MKLRDVIEKFNYEMTYSANNPEKSLSLGSNQKEVTEHIAEVIDSVDDLNYDLMPGDPDSLKVFLQILLVDARGAAG